MIWSSRQQVALQSLTLLGGRHQAVHLVGLWDVQLGTLCHLLELCALVEGAAEASLPGRWAVTAAIIQLAFKVGPGLHSRGSEVRGCGCGHEGQRSQAILTLKMAASSSLRKSCFPACFHGMRNMVLASSSQTRPGYLPLHTCTNAQSSHKNKPTKNNYLFHRAARISSPLNEIQIQVSSHFWKIYIKGTQNDDILIINIT